MVRIWKNLVEMITELASSEIAKTNLIRVYSRMCDCGIHAVFFLDHTQFLTQCKTVPCSKFVKEMPETSA